ncbi:MAG: hypothetical protein H6636_03830 [Anaerolineales bacterium]|nr:hypothetical protein [Anaerolineales bacterium]
MKTKSFYLWALLTLCLASSTWLLVAAPSPVLAETPPAQTSPATFLNPDGTLRLDGSFQGNLDLRGYHVEMNAQDGVHLSPASPESDLNNYVFALAVSGTDVYVGGWFTNTAGIPEADYIAKWDGANWSALGNNGAGNGSINGIVRTIALDGANVYVGGSFSDVNNFGTPLTAADAIAIWDGYNWSALGHNGAGNGSILPGAHVGTITINDVNVYVGGNFIDVNNYGTVLGAADKLAVWNTQTHNWSALGGDGAGDGSIEDEVMTIAVDGVNVYAGGIFHEVNNYGTVLTKAAYLARWNGTNWTALGDNGVGGAALNNVVTTLLPVGTDIYVGGFFTDTAGLPEADYIARWDGANWHALGSNGLGDGALDRGVMSLARSGFSLYVGGWFYRVSNNGVTVSTANYVARWNGTTWSGLGDDGHGSGVLYSSVYAVATSGADVYVGGAFPYLVNQGLLLSEARYAAQWDGTNWHALHTDFTPPAVWAISLVYPNPVTGPLAYFRVDFTEPVVGVDLTDFALTPDGLPNATLASLTGSDALYYVTVNVGQGIGSVRLDLVDDDTIHDTSYNPLGGVGAGNGNYTVGEPAVVAPPTVYLPLIVR